VVDGSSASPRLALAETPTPDPNAPDHTQTFAEQYLSYQLSPAALPAVKDGQLMSIVLGYLCAPACGSLWGPLVMVKGAEFSADVAITWFLSSIVWGAASTVTGGLLLPVVPYLQTTATLNAIDVQMKKKGFKAPPSSSTPAQPGQPQPTEQPPPSYAY
jgi:hypothetical protein